MNLCIQSQHYYLKYLTQHKNLILITESLRMRTRVSAP